MSFDLGDELQKLEADGKISLMPVKGTEAIDPHKFPEFAMGGVAGKFATLYNEYLESPKVFFFVAFLTCLGSLLSKKITLDSELRPQPRLFSQLIGESADDRKSSAIDETKKFFKETIPDFKTCHGIGSAEGLQKRIEESSPNGLLLIFDEMKAFVSKCKIEASVLLPCVNTLFESNHYESRTKTTDICLEDAHLSLLSASTSQTYETMWTSQFTDIGFLNRLFIVPASGERKYAIPKKIPLDKKEALKTELTVLLEWIGDFRELPIAPDAMTIYKDWYFSLEKSVHAKRIDSYALRLLPLIAINEGKTIVDQHIVKKVIAIMNWQLEARRRYDPIDSDNQVARMENRIRRALSQPQSNRDLKRRCNINRYGIWIFETAAKNLVRSKEVYFDKKSKMWVLCESLSSKLSSPT